MMWNYALLYSRNQNLNVEVFTDSVATLLKWNSNSNNGGQQPMYQVCADLRLAMHPELTQVEEVTQEDVVPG
jgi:hypothetical protein